ncbi:MAG TPA: hypothetical protein VLM89_11175 [Phycisphaerae bacterium]|nr:hypothetical protein [Phycisphaerae bacterium]
MNVELTCEKCGHPFRLPREQAGHVGKCPRCGNDVYIPTPESEIEELPLAPEDRSQEQLARQLEAERRRLDRDLAREKDKAAGAAGGSQPARRSEPSTTAGRTTVRGAVMNYLTAMRDSDLDRADHALKLLASRRDDVLRLLDQLAADQIPPAEMSNVPPGVYQGFLKSLRSKL